MVVRIETYSEPAEGVAIERDGDTKPILVIPFPQDRLRHAESLDDDTVLFIGLVQASEPRYGNLLLASYDLASLRFTRRAEIAEAKHLLFSRISRDRRLLFMSNGGIKVIDLATFTPIKDFREYDPATGSMVPWDPERRDFSSLMVRSAHQVTEIDDTHLLYVDPAPFRIGGHGDLVPQTALRIDLDTSRATCRLLLSLDGSGVLGHVDPLASLALVTTRQVAVFEARTPLPLVDAVEGVLSIGAEGSAGVGDGPALYGLSVHLWHLGDSDAMPFTIVIRAAEATAWKVGLLMRRVDTAEQTANEQAIRMLDAPGDLAVDPRPNLWRRAAEAFISSMCEDPHDGRIWIAFSDSVVRSLKVDGTLGPIITLNRGLNERGGPSIAFDGDGWIVVSVSQTWSMAWYRFDPRTVEDRPQPISVDPVERDDLDGRHEKAFAAFVRKQTRRRLTLRGWTRDSCAAALTKQTAIIAKGLSGLVLASSQCLNFTYWKGKTELDEAEFFRAIVERAIPVAPELRALLLAYVEQLGEGGEGVQPWQDPDEAIGGLGSALRALALLDPDCLDVLRAYLETRDGEHEGYSLDVVVPDYLDHHGWRDAATVRFAIYATLNRYWGGSKPAGGFDGMFEAMAELMTPEDVAATVLREAEHFGRKPDYDYDAAAYRAAFRTLLDPANAFETAVLAIIAQAAPDADLRDVER